LARSILPQRTVIATAAREEDYAPRESLLWRMAQVAIIGIFLIVLCVALDLAGSILVPITSAIVVGTIFGPLERRLTEHKIPSWVLAAVVVLGIFILLQLSAVLLSSAIISWINHAGDFSTTLQSKLRAFEGGMKALHDLQKALGAKDGGLSLSIAPLLQMTAAFLTPTLAELLIFFSTLFFYLAGREEMRRQFVLAFSSRESRLRTLRIINEVEENLARYFATVTVINAVVGTLTGIGTWLLGFSNPLLFGALAFACNYIPYLGPAFVVVVLFSVGIVALPTLGASLWAPLLYVGLTTLEGNLITPNIIGRRLTLNPFAILVGLTFWAFLWGPIGAFLSVPFLIIALAIRDNLMPDETPELPA
jgi:predicted PurR-regulated permease PerM